MTWCEYGSLKGASLTRFSKLEVTNRNVEHRHKMSVFAYNTSHLPLITMGIGATEQPLLAAAVPAGLVKALSHEFNPMPHSGNQLQALSKARPLRGDSNA